LGRQVEKTIFLPDALGGMLAPYRIAYDSVHNPVHVGARFGNCITAIDS